MKLQVHGEEWDGGWENLAGNQNTSVHGTGTFSIPSLEETVFFTYSTRGP